MAKNIEIKARINDRERFRSKAEALSSTKSILISQEDVFFNCSNGRLKLRILSEKVGQLVFYNRPDMAGPKMSYYIISTTEEPRTLCKVMSEAYGVLAVVRKERNLIMLGRTRIHLDEVESLGSFLELEVVLADGEDEQKGIEEANRIMDQLGIRQDSLIDCAYVDLLLSSGANA